MAFTQSRVQSAQGSALLENSSNAALDPRTLILAASSLAAAAAAAATSTKNDPCGIFSDNDTESTASGDISCDHSSAQSVTDVAVLDTVDDAVDVNAWQAVGRGLAEVFKDELEMPEVNAWQAVGRGLAGVFKDELEMPQVKSWHSLGLGLASVFREMSCEA